MILPHHSACLVVSLAVWAGFAPAGQAEPSARGRRAVALDGIDVLVAPGEPARLAFKLERAGVRRADLERREVVFALGDRTLGRVTGDDEGEGSIEWMPPGPGDYPVRLAFAGDRRFAPAEGSLACSVRDPDRPTVVLDIDDTLAVTSNRDVIAGTVDSPALPYAAWAVGRLAARYALLYLTARPGKWQDVTRRWLDGHGFPRAPILFRDLEAIADLGEATYKTRLLSRLVARFPGVAIGVGNKPSDAIAYRAAGMRALILGDPGPAPGAERVRDWLEVEALLSADPPAPVRAPGFEDLGVGP